jgi:hypothetical protein
VLRTEQAEPTTLTITRRDVVAGSIDPVVLDPQIDVNVGWWVGDPEGPRPAALFSTSCNIMAVA